MRTSVQIDFLRRVLSSLREEHCRIYMDVFDILRTKLATAATKIQSMVKAESPQNSTAKGVKRWKYLLMRDTLDAAIVDLERWQRIFEPTWYLVLRVADKQIDSTLLGDSERSLEYTQQDEDASTAVGSNPGTPASLETARTLRQILKGDLNANIHVTLPAKGLQWETAMNLPFSTVQTIQRIGSHKAFIMDSIDCTSGVNIAQARNDAETLARKLKQVEPDTFNMLNCQGLVKRKPENSKLLTSIDLIFHQPVEGAQAASLRAQLLSKSSITLTRRVEIARHLAKAISFVHTCDFVHKNIRPETILVFPDKKSPMGTAYLMGFDSFRSTDHQTLRKGDIAWETNLYRHPQRQGIYAQEDYSMQHDIYSLGVCLLELGLWDSFVDYCEEGDAATKHPSAALGLTLSDFGPGSGDLSTVSRRIQDHLVMMAETKLPERAGEKYAQVVVTCLTCTDEDNEDFGDDMTDEDGILIGVRFIEKVLFRLDSISV